MLTAGQLLASAANQLQHHVPAQAITPLSAGKITHHAVPGGGTIPLGSLVGGRWAGDRREADAGRRRVGALLPVLWVYFRRCAGWGDAHVNSPSLSPPSPNLNL
jgi:hypothetical protein